MLNCCIASQIEQASGRRWRKNLVLALIRPEGRRGGFERIEPLE
jgi:hypothetical protein